MTMLTVLAVDLFERSVPFRQPFRFGAVTLAGADEAFVRVRLAVDQREVEGWAADLLVGKWFDKRAEISLDAAADGLRRSLRIAAESFLAGGHAPSAYALSCAATPDAVASGLRANLTRLGAGFGPALIDRAILDALGRAFGISVEELVRTNKMGLDASHAPDLRDVDIARTLSCLKTVRSIALRHTIGLLDPLTDAQSSLAEDGSPRSLNSAIAAHGLNRFKIKLSGDLQQDLERLANIAALVGGIAGLSVTLDGNEQFASPDVAEALIRKALEDARTVGLVRAMIYFEQPVPREVALSMPLGGLGARCAVGIDEADDADDAFPRARALGYRVVSSKSCKGVYRALLNAIRVAGDWHCFMSAEDLTAQAGIAVQQDLALAGILGLPDCERNGHHFAHSFATTTPTERQRFLHDHGDLYDGDEHAVRLRVSNGRLSLVSVLAAQGFGSAATPDEASLRPLR